MPALAALLVAFALGLALECAAQSEATDDKQAMIELGLQHETAWDLYRTLRSQAEGDGAIDFGDFTFD